jgi:alkanesulfonate monooxygenase SsuD/methylene tetrahydromethanopterin reductase-like flavin-dependent oxidoreductase (luciferase family)
MLEEKHAGRMRRAKMAAHDVTFGWVVSPQTAAQGGSAAESTRATQTLLEQDRAFIDRLPSQFTTLWVEDHFQWQADPTLECFITMSYFAALFPTLRMGSIVLGQSYRNPALTAKMAATLQALTGGRFILGIGAGWKQDEYEAYGYDYPGAGARIEQLEDAVQIIKTMFSEIPATFHGKHYHIQDAFCEPRPYPAVPLLIGGKGEKKTLRVVAKYADMWNGNFTTSEEYAQKQEVLAAHCRDVGRDPSEIIYTYYGIVDLSDPREDQDAPSPLHILRGGSTQVARELRALIDLGVRHFMIRFTDFPSTTGLERFTSEVLSALDLA